MRAAILSVLAIAAAAACARGNTTRYAQWPYEGPMMMVRNPTPNPVVVLAAWAASSSPRDSDQTATNASGGHSFMQSGIWSLRAGIRCRRSPSNLGRPTDGSGRVSSSRGQIPRSAAKTSFCYYARHDVVIEAHSEPQRVDADAFVVSVHAARVALGQREGTESVARDAELPEIVAVGETGEHLRRGLAPVLPVGGESALCGRCTPSAECVGRLLPGCS